MRFRKYLFLEVKRLLGRRYLTIVLIFFLAAGYFVQYGISQYKHTLDERNNFQQFEKEKYQHFVYPSYYGNYGFRLLFIPSSFIAFFNGGPVPAFLTAYIDGSERMKIYQPLKGQNVFSRITSGFMTFGGFILLFGSLLVLLYGRDTLNNHEWLEFLEGITDSRKKLFLYLIASGAVLLLLICLLLAAGSIIIFIINRVGIEPVKIIGYTLVIYVMLLVFWLIGLIAGAAKNQLKGIAISITVWFLLAFLVPVILYHWTYSRSMSINSPYKMESVKQKLFGGYERGGKDKGGKFDANKRGTDLEEDMFLAFWNGDFRKMMELEKVMLEEMKTRISFYQNVAALFPSTFFLSVSNEASSQGFSNLVKFYEFSHEKKKAFIWYLADNYLLSKEMKFSPFLKENENIFIGKSLLPGNFGFGFMVIVVWLLLLFYYSWNLFNRLFKRFAEDAKDLAPDDFKKNKTTVVLTANQGLASGLLFKLRMEKTRLVAVPGPASLPGEVKVKDLFSFLGQDVPEKLQPVAGKYIHDLSPERKGLISIEIARSWEAEIYIFNNLLSGLSDKFADYFADFLKTFKKGRKVVYFSSSQRISVKIADNVLRLLNDTSLF